MTILFDYNNLWKEKGYGKDGHTLEVTIKWLRKTALQSGIEPDIADMAIREIMQDVIAGLEFPLDKCPCGCGIDKSGTAINHAMRKRMYEIDRDVHTTIASMLEKRHNDSIMKYIEEQNIRYVAEVMPPKRKIKVLNETAKAAIATILISEAGIIFIVALAVGVKYGLRLF